MDVLGGPRPWHPTRKSDIAARPKGRGLPAYSMPLEAAAARSRTRGIGYRPATAQARPTGTSWACSAAWSREVAIRIPETTTANGRRVGYRFFDETPPTSSVRVVPVAILDTPACYRHVSGTTHLRSAGPNVAGRHSWAPLNVLSALVVRRGFGLVGEGGSATADFGDDLLRWCVPDEGLGVVVPV